MIEYDSADMSQMRKRMKLGPVEAALYYAQMGQAAREHGMEDEAEQYFKKSLKVRLDFDKNAVSADNANRLAVKYVELGEIARDDRRFGEAECLFKKSLEIRLELLKTRMISKENRSLCVSYNRLAGVSANLRKYDEALMYLEKMLESCLARTEKNGTETDFFDLQACYYSMGSVLHDSLKRPDEAEAMFMAAIRVYTENDYPSLAKLAGKARKRLNDYY